MQLCCRVFVARALTKEQRAFLHQVRSDLEDVFGGMNQTVIVEDLHQRQRGHESRDNDNKSVSRIKRYVIAGMSEVIRTYGRTSLKAFLDWCDTICADRRLTANLKRNHVHACVFKGVSVARLWHTSSTGRPLIDVTCCLEECSIVNLSRIHSERF